METDAQKYLPVCNRILAGDYSDGLGTTILEFCANGFIKCPGTNRIVFEDGTAIALSWAIA